MGRHHLYRYYSNLDWAEQFVAGQIRFNTLAYYRRIEKDGARDDPNEGVSLYAPSGGLKINNLTSGQTYILQDSVFRSEVGENGIYICCLSRTFSRRLWDGFGSRVCVEILDIGEFHRRVTSALPSGARLADQNGRQRIGHRVAYYDEEKPPNPRWAVPHLVATSKLRERFGWQDEYRLLFGMGDVLSVYDVNLQIGPNTEPGQLTELEPKLIEVSAGAMRDICRIRYERELP